MRSPLCKGHEDRAYSRELLHPRLCVPSTVQCHEVTAELVQESSAGTLFSLHFLVYKTKHFSPNEAPQGVGDCSDEPVQGYPCNLPAIQLHRVNTLQGTVSPPQRSAKEI